MCFWGFICFARPESQRRTSCACLCACVLVLSLWRDSDRKPYFTGTASTTLFSWWAIPGKEILFSSQGDFLCLPGLVFGLTSWFAVKTLSPSRHRKNSSCFLTPPHLFSRSSPQEVPTDSDHSEAKQNQREKVVEIRHLGQAQIQNYVSFCKFFNKVTYISSSSFGIWSGIATWQCNWKRKWVFAFGFILLLIGRKLHIIIFWSSSLLSDYGVGRRARPVGRVEGRLCCIHIFSYCNPCEKSLWNETLIPLPRYLHFIKVYQNPVRKDEKNLTPKAPVEMYQEQPQILSNWSLGKERGFLRMISTGLLPSKGGR